MTIAKAMFGAGCFWGVEATFRAIPGVLEVAVGYSGGAVENPTYQQVCTDTTGHAEVVEVTYDPEQVVYDALLETFWACHNPTQVNRQGPDIGHQYRSAIYTFDATQESAAVAAKQALGESSRFERPIATEIKPAEQFWRAEEYHQRYFEKRGLVACPTH